VLREAPPGPNGDIVALRTSAERGPGKDEVKMTNYAVLIGVNDYKTQPGLRGCVNDVQDLKNLLTKSGSVDAANLEVITDAAATKDAILKALTNLIGKLNGGEVGYFHFSGHGVRVPSNSQVEPDGLDEALCPHEFDWSAAATITDKELLRSLANMKQGASLVCSFDSCHSGDFTRGLLRPGVRARTLTPPSAIAAEIARRGLRGPGLRQVALANGVTVVSACLPFQEAADAEFEGRPNGAFTYHLLRELGRNSHSPASKTIEAIAPDLRHFEMDPTVEGAAEVPILVGRRTRSAEGLLTGVRATGARRVVYNGSWDSNLLGQRLGVGLRITSQSGSLYANLSALVFGAPLEIAPIPLQGNLELAIPLGLLGAELVFGVSRWRSDQQAISFTVTIEVRMGIFFGSKVRVAEVPVSVPLSTMTRGPEARAPKSAEEMVAMLTLNSLSTGPLVETSGPRAVQTPTVYGSRELLVQVVGADIAKWGPNWREDRIIRPFANRARPNGLRRWGLPKLGPQRGSGNVYVVGWLSDQESDFDFILHMGNNFFGGWGEIDWLVEGYYAVNDPFPNRALEEPAPQGEVSSQPSRPAESNGRVKHA
jgi:hypothetical protein